MLKREKNIKTERPARPAHPLYWPDIPIIEEPKKMENPARPR